MCLPCLVLVCQELPFPVPCCVVSVLLGYFIKADKVNVVIHNFRWVGIYKLWAPLIITLRDPYLTLISNYREHVHACENNYYGAD